MEIDLGKVFDSLLGNYKPSEHAPLMAIIAGKTNSAIMVMNSGNGPLINCGTAKTPNWKHLIELNNEQLEYIREEHSFLAEACDKILSERRNASI